MKARRYRLRILNGSNARYYQLFLADSSGRSYPVAVIATEGGLLSRTVPSVDSVLMSPALHFELILDFSGLKPGVPLRPFRPVSAADLSSAVYREFEFSRSEGSWTSRSRWPAPPEPTRDLALEKRLRRLVAPHPHP